jgi:hypothetical protein
MLHCRVSEVSFPHVVGLMDLLLHPFPHDGIITAAEALGLGKAASIKIQLYLMISFKVFRCLLFRVRI